MKKTFLIPTYDRPSLEYCLLSIRKQTEPVNEIIIIDDDSRNMEFNRRLAKEFGCKYILVDWGEKRFRRNLCLNIGLGAAGNEGIIFVSDADMLFYDDYVARCMKYHRKYTNLLLYPRIGYLDVGMDTKELIFKWHERMLHNHVWNWFGPEAGFSDKEIMLAETGFATGIVSFDAANQLRYNGDLFGWGADTPSLHVKAVVSGVFPAAFRDIQAFHLNHDRTWAGILTNAGEVDWEAYNKALEGLSLNVRD